MKRRYFRITVAVVASILFLGTAVAHACIGTFASHSAHDHGGIHAAGRVQTPHPESQDENCRSVRDRLISLAPRPAEAHSLVANLDVIPIIGEQIITAIQAFTAERPPGNHSVGGDQPPLYIFNSVFRL
jgi:hypothetical protein